MFTTRIKQKSISNIFLSIIIIATIPLAVYSIINSNLDMRKHAYEETNLGRKCTITLPYINHKTIAAGGNYKVLVNAEFIGEKITEIEIRNKFGQEVFSKEFLPSTSKINEQFRFAPTSRTEENFHGTIKTGKNSYPCEMLKDTLLVVEKNTSPLFLTDPYINSIPKTNALIVGEQYEYVLEATDRDGDQIHYYFPEKPEWIHYEILESGEYGRLKIKLKGVPEEPGDYLTTIFMHDGYRQNISSQTWIIYAGYDRADTRQKPRPAEPIIAEIRGEFDNAIKFDNPHITDISPLENSSTENVRLMIYATINSSYDADIIEGSIIFELNGKDILSETSVLKITPDEYILTYTPGTDLEKGEHQVLLSFEDTDDLTSQKDWTFRIDLEEEETRLFGIPITTIIIIALGFLLILLALSIPWILYIAWRKNTEEDYKEASIPKISISKSLSEKHPRR